MPAPGDAVGLGLALGDAREGFLVGDLEIVRVGGLAPKRIEHGVRRAGDGGIHVGAGGGGFLHQPGFPIPVDAIHRVKNCGVVGGHIVRGDRRRVAREPRRVEHLLVPIEDGIVAKGEGGPQGTYRQGEPDET